MSTFDTGLPGFPFPTHEKSRRLMIEVLDSERSLRAVGMRFAAAAKAGDVLATIVGGDESALVFEGVKKLSGEKETLVILPITDSDSNNLAPFFDRIQNARKSDQWRAIGKMGLSLFHATCDGSQCAVFAILSLQVGDLGSLHLRLCMSCNAAIVETMAKVRNILVTDQELPPADSVGEDRPELLLKVVGDRQVGVEIPAELADDLLQFQLYAALPPAVASPESTPLRARVN